MTAPRNRTVGRICTWLAPAVALMILAGACSMAAQGEDSMINERIALGMPALAGYDIFSALEKSKGLKFQSVMSLPGGPNTKHSLGEFPTFDFYDGSVQHRERLKEVLSGFKHVSVHQAWDENWRAWIDCADYFGAKVVTVHIPPAKPEDPKGESKQNQITYFREIGDYAQGKGIKVGVENTGGEYADYVDLIGSIDHPAVGATIDVGHCAYFSEVRSIADVDDKVKVYNEILCRLVDDLGEKVYHFHIHNVRKADWRDHRAVTEGVIDFPRLFAAIKKIGYPGLFDIELEEPEREKKSSESGEYLSKLIVQSGMR